MTSEAIWTQLGTATVVMGVLGWLGKALGERWFEKLDKRDARRQERELERFRLIWQ